MKFIKILGVVIFVYCCLGIFNIAKAETPDGDPPIYEQPGLIKKPVYCGPTEFMLRTVTENFNNEPLVVGKVIIPQTGELVAMLTVFVHKDRLKDMSVLMTMLDKNETCVLGYGVELMFYDEVKENKVKPEVNPGTYNGVWQTVNFNF
tara:strand:+ start:359 stop:802 length:444 start_codon:yes stop_codon:yes gene_type:complete